MTAVEAGRNNQILITLRNNQTGVLVVALITLKNKPIEMQLVYIVEQISTVQESESAVHENVSPLWGFPSHLEHHRELNRLP